MDPLSIALFAAKTWGPSLVGKLMGDKAEKVADDVVSLAKGITGKKDASEAMEALKSDPNLALEFQQSLMSYSLELEREETIRLKTVNETMQAEAKSEHWMQWSWRPFNGYLFGITLFMNYVFPNIANMWIEKADDYLTPGTIPEMVLMAWAAVLGVTAWHRGVQKRVASGETNTSAVGNLKNLVDRTLK